MRKFEAWWDKASFTFGVAALLYCLFLGRTTLGIALFSLIVTSPMVVRKRR